MRRGPQVDGSSADRGLVSRRVVLLGVAGVVVGAGTLRVDAAADDVVEPRTVPQPHLLPPPTVLTRVPAWARRWHTPIYDLDDFLRRDRDAHRPRRSVMLTIDDGPSPVWTPLYLRLLAKHDITATFNLIGEQVLPNRTIVRALASEGHVVANHTWTHDERLPSRSRRDIHREIAHTNEAIHEVTGRRPTQFRAPGGVWGPRVYAELARQEMMPVDWNVDPRDWARPGSAEIENALRGARAGDILLCHDGGGDRSQTYRALSVVLPELKHRGLTFTTLP